MPAEAVFKQRELLHNSIATRKLESNTVVAQPEPLGPTLTILEGRDSALSTTSITSRDSTTTVHSDVFQKDAVVQKKKNSGKRKAAGWFERRRGVPTPPPPEMVPVTWPIPPDCPPGLEWLVNASAIYIEQQIELMEVMTGFEMNNRYIILNDWGQPIYYAMEDTDCMSRVCLGAHRGFTINIFDVEMRPAMVLTRPFKCCGSACCINEINIEAPPGYPNGIVDEQFECGKAANFMVLNLNNENAVYIQGPKCGTTGCAMCCDIEWEVQEPATGTPIGIISKIYSGAIREFFTDADTFGLTFPPDLDVRIKANLLGVTFLIDFMYYERSGDKNR